MPPNVTFGAPPTKDSNRAPSRRRKRRRLLTAVTVPVLAVAAFAVGNEMEASTEVIADQIQTRLLAMVDGSTDEPEAEPAAEGSCHPGYVDCVPFDLTEDLDCEDLAITDVRLHDLAWDPYGLDDNGDGIGCESN
jgi:hypothetical protein